MKLLELLYNQEYRYIDEIDRLERYPDEVTFVENSEDSGWVCLGTNDNSFDWNIARLVGNIDIAKRAIEKIPFNDYVLLTDEDSDLSEIEFLKPNGSLLYFENSVSVSSEYNEMESNTYLNSSEVGLPKECIKPKASSLNSRIDDLYLIMKNRVCGYIKVIKNTWHYSEVAIEINAEYRNQGYGTALMELMTRQFALKGQKLSYVVEEDNIASLKLARNFLRESFKLDKYILR